MWQLSGPVSTNFKLKVITSQVLDADIQGDVRIASMFICLTKIVGGNLQSSNLTTHSAMVTSRQVIE